MTPFILTQLFLVYILLSFVSAFLGRRRRIGFWGFFFMSLIVTPLFTAIFIFCAAPATPPRPSRKRT